MKRYRIKTKKEFEDEFGPNWRERVDYLFPREMDYLLGTVLPKESINLIELKQPIQIKKLDANSYWLIGHQMIKEDLLKDKINKLLNI